MSTFTILTECFNFSMYFFKKEYLCLIGNNTLAKILTSNSVGTQLFLLGYNQDNIVDSNFMTKKKICLVLPEKEISNHRN